MPAKPDLLKNRSERPVARHILGQGLLRTSSLVSKLGNVDLAEAIKVAIEDHLGVGVYDRVWIRR